MKMLEEVLVAIVGVAVVAVIGVPAVIGFGWFVVKYGAWVVRLLGPPI